MSKYNKKNNISSDETSKKLTSSDSSKSLNNKKNKESNSEENNSSDEKPVGKLGKKDLKNLERQKEIFEELKELLQITTERNTFTSFDVEKIKDTIMINLFPKIMESFNFKIWASQSDIQTFHHMSIIRKMFKYYGYEITYKGTSKVIDGKRNQGRKYYLSKKSI
jgi:hypothetical protein